MTTLQRISHRVQPARRRSLAAFAPLALARPAPVHPFAVGVPPRPRSPKGGVVVAGRYYRPGAYLPATAAVYGETTAPASGVDLSAFAGAAAFARPGEFADAPAGMGWVALTPTAGVLRPIGPEDTTDHAAASGPSPRDEAFKLGYDLGLDREDADAPDHYGPELVGEFEAGWAAGRREWDRRLEEMCGASEYAAWSGSITDLDVYAPGGVS